MMPPDTPKEEARQRWEANGSTIKQYSGSHLAFMEKLLECFQRLLELSDNNLKYQRRVLNTDSDPLDSLRHQRAKQVLK